MSSSEGEGDRHQTPARERVPRSTAVSLVVAAALAMGLIAIVASLTGPEDERTLPTSIDLIIMPHPDDEMESWAVIEQRPETFHVFVYATLGEESRFCDATLPGYQAQSGEVAPMPRPAGRFTKECSLARIGSSLRFLRQMARGDAGLPQVLDERTVEVGDALVGDVEPLRRSDDGVDRPTDAVPVVFGGDQQGLAIFWNGGDGDLTSAEVRWMVDFVIRHRSDLGIPDLPWNRLIAGGFYNPGLGDGCVDYAHPDHRAVHEAVHVAHEAFSEQLAPTCRTDPASTITLTVQHFGHAMDLGLFAPDEHPRRLGAHHKYFGWLNTPYFTPDWDGQGQLIHRHQHYWVVSSQDDAGTSSSSDE